MIIKTFEFAYLIPRDAYYITECCQGEQGPRKKGTGGGRTEKRVLERKEGTIDVKRGREEIWKGIRAREQFIRRGKQWDRGREGEGGTEKGRERGIRAGRYEGGN